MREAPDGGHDAVVMLAAGVVLAFGASFCAFFILFAAENASNALLIAVAGFTVAVGLIWILSTEPMDPEEKRHWWSRLLRRRLPTRTYRPKPRMKTKVIEIEYGTNEPPSVESVRQIKSETDGVRNWSPKTRPQSSPEPHPSQPGDSPLTRPEGTSPQSAGPSAS